MTRCTKGNLPGNSSSTRERTMMQKFFYRRMSVRVLLQNMMASIVLCQSSSRPGNVFESNPQLAQELRFQGITQIAVVGVQSDCCVRSSILGAIASGFDARDIMLLQGTHSTFDDAEEGRSYSQIKKDVEDELGALGVELMRWQDFVR
jgi:hypothetical protein